MPELPGDVWLRCSACKKDLRFGQIHWVCSVSTCNRNRTRLVFCSVPCWDSHVAMLRHREAWAVEAKAPTALEWAKVQAEEVAAAPTPPPPGPADVPGTGGVARKVVTAPAPASASASSGPALGEKYDREILIVVSKLKKYIKDRSGMNTSDAVAEVLSDHVRAICDEAIRTAGTEGRKTVLDRDVPKPVRRG